LPTVFQTPAILFRVCSDSDLLLIIFRYVSQAWAMTTLRQQRSIQSTLTPSFLCAVLFTVLPLQFDLTPMAM